MSQPQSWQAYPSNPGNIMGTLTQGFERLLCGWCQRKLFPGLFLRHEVRLTIREAKDDSTGTVH